MSSTELASSVKRPNLKRSKLLGLSSNDNSYSMDVKSPLTNGKKKKKNILLRNNLPPTRKQLRKVQREGSNLKLLRVAPLHQRNLGFQKYDHTLPFWPLEKIQIL